MSSYDPTRDDLGYGDPSETSEVPLSDERPEASESGIVTEMEHRRSESMSSVDLRQFEASTGGGDTQKKPKSGRRLSTRVARGLKKHIKGDKSRPRSHSPPRSQQSLTANSCEGLELGERPKCDVAPRRMVTEPVTYGPKKKHKSKFKPVAKAAASAAKKIIGSSSSKHKEETTHSANSSRAGTPTNLHGSINHVNMAAIDTALQELPETLAKDDTEAAEEENSLAEEPTKFAPDAAPAVTTTEPAAAAAPASAVPTPTEDEALKLAEAMALAFSSNPTKSQDEIRKMVYSQPEFKHLAPPEQPSKHSSSSGHGSDSTSKLLKKNFSSFKKQFTSGAGTAQKKFLEMTESTNLGSSISSFSFGMSGSSGTSSSKSHYSASTTKIPSAAAVASIERAVSPVGGGKASLHQSIAGIPPSLLNASNSISSASPLVTTIPEESQLPLAAAGTVSLQNSVELTEATEDAAATTKPAAVPPAASDAATITVPTATTGSKKWRDLPIKVSEIVWKRRSGFGKFSTDAWERRRFVLQGNVLSYYRAKDEHSTEPMDDETEHFEASRNNTMNASASDVVAGKPSGSSSSTSKSSKQRMFDYMEQVAISAGLPTSVLPEKSEEEKKSARGYMDLIKENAVICATLGHSGAPSPFCLSIKVGGETKWKLCFSSHRSQLQWMAAISDVIVQASVDIYNVKLLTKADPANHDPTQAFQHVYEPPAGSLEEQQPTSQKSMDGSQKRDAEGEDELLPQPSLQVSGKRLWIMEAYVIRPQDAEDEEGGEDGEWSDDDDEEDESPATAEKSADTGLVDDRDIWFLPQKKLHMAALVINAALLYARNSTMSPQTFWMVITIANMGLFSFLEAKPHPSTSRSAAPAPAPRKVRKFKKRKGKRKDAAGPGGGGSGADKDSGAAGAKAKKEEPYKPLAGLTAIKLNNPHDSNENANGDKFAGWRSVEGETIQIRSHGYMTTKAKIPSPGTLYELAQMDIFESPARYPDMAPRVKLPKLTYDIDPSEEKTWKSPDHFVVSLSLPTDPPKLGGSATDGGGYTVTMYYTMRKTTRDILKRVTAEGYQPSSEEPPEDIQKWQVNGARLFEEWCRRAPNDIKFQTRFKMVPNVVNAKEIGLPSWIGKYNGKPLLIKRPGQTGFLLPHPEISCIEFDISLHVFPYLAKQGICYMKDTMFKKLLATVGFVIEGRDDDELPEVLIGLGQVCYPDPEYAMQAGGFFAGTAPKSYDPEEDTKAPTPAPAAPAVDPAAPEQPVG